MLLTSAFEQMCPRVNLLECSKQTVRLARVERPCHIASRILKAEQ